MSLNLSDQAINLALKSKWEEAIKINKQIIDDEPENTDALNRLARAFYEIGKIKDAKSTSEKVIKIESSNKIAEKALEKYKRSLATSDKKTNKVSPIGNNQNFNVSDFIEDFRTTKHTTLLNLCSDEIISTLDSGDEVLLSAHSHKVTVTTLNHKYLGKLPDDLSAKLRVLTKKGYKYKVLIKSAENKCVKIIIKEIKRGKGYENVQSFPYESSESLSEFSS